MKKLFLVALCLTVGLSMAAPISGPATHPTAQSNGQGNAPDWLFLSCTPSGADSLLMVQQTTSPANLMTVAPLGSATWLVNQGTAAAVANAWPTYMTAAPTANGVSSTPQTDASIGAVNALAVRMVQPTDGVGAVYRNGSALTTATTATLLMGGVAELGSLIARPFAGLLDSTFHPNGGANGFVVPSNATSADQFTAAFPSLLVNGTGGLRGHSQTGTPSSDSGSGAGGYRRAAADTVSLGANRVNSATTITVGVGNSGGATAVIASGVNKIIVRLPMVVGTGFRSVTQFIECSFNGGGQVATMADAVRNSGFAVTVADADVTALAGAIFVGEMVMDNLNIGPTGATLFAVSANGGGTDGMTLITLQVQ